MLNKPVSILFALMLSAALPSAVLAADDDVHTHDHVSFGMEPLGNLLTTKDASGKTRALTNDEVKTLVIKKTQPYFEQGMMHRIKNNEVRIQKETVSMDIVDLGNNPVDTLTFDRKTGINMAEMGTYKLMEKQEADAAARRAYAEEQLQKQRAAVKALSAQQPADQAAAAAKSAKPAAANPTPTGAPTVNKKQSAPKTTTNAPAKQQSPAKK